jgi:hypothetical protein
LVDIITDMSTPERTTTTGAGLPVRSVPPAITQRSTPQVDHLFSTLVEAAFDLIEEIGSISLAIYLHVPHDDQPILFTRKPQLEFLNPTETFRLMHTIAMLSNGRKPVAAFRHGALSGHYVRTTGNDSDGLFVFGEIQAPEVAKRLTAISNAFARVLHQFHLDEDGERFDPPLLDIDDHEGLSQATVTIQHDGRQAQATANGFRPEDAVAKAVIVALAPDHTFDEVRTLDVGTRSAVLVVTHDARGVLRLGLAISDGDVLQTTAVAAQRAVVDLVPDDPETPASRSSSRSPS